MKAPAFQFYPQDFISSLDVQVMNVEQVGAYMLLLSNAWIHEPQGYLPNNDLLLQRICRMNDKQWSKNKSLILKKFEKAGEFIFNARLLKELEKQGEYRKKQAQNGAKGGRPKANPKPEKPTALSGLTQPKPKKSSSISSSISSSTSEDNSIGTTVPKLSIAEMFEQCRKIYPGTKRGPEVELSEFAKKYKPEFSADFFRVIYKGIALKIKTNKELERAGRLVPEWPHFKTYLYQRRWEDQTEVPRPKSAHDLEPKPYYTQSQEEQDELFGGLSEFGKRQRELERQQVKAA